MVIIIALNIVIDRIAKSKHVFAIETCVLNDPIVVASLHVLLYFYSHHPYCWCLIHIYFQAHPCKIPRKEFFLFVELNFHIETNQQQQQQPRKSQWKWCGKEKRIIHNNNKEIVKLMMTKLLTWKRTILTRFAVGICFLWLSCTHWLYTILCTYICVPVQSI